MNAFEMLGVLVFSSVVALVAVLTYGVLGSVAVLVGAIVGVAMFGLLRFALSGRRPVDGD